MGFVETLERSPDIIGLRNNERTQLLAIVDLLGELNESSYSSVYDGLDKPGRRFWVAVRFQCLCSQRKFGRLVAEELGVNSRLLAWAFQSDCQDSILSSLLSANPSWPEMRNLGMGFWFTNASQLRTRMEKLARSQYLIKKDPKDCALLYLALNRVQVLVGLFKISKDEKDKPLVGFLSRNFQEEKNKAAALKNAYVLMGRHQLELAISFFLLGGDPSSAVNVCAKNLGDQQLALVICRLIEGHGGKLESQLVSNILLPNAIEKKDYWLASLFEWTLGNYSCSINKLLDSHLDPLIHNSAVSNLCAFLDPEIGQYCVTIATKNNMKGSLGDYPALALSKLATLMSVRAFNRCGFPLEALECYSSFFNIEGNDRGSLLDVESHIIFRRILKPISTSTSNWVLAGIVDALELDAKLSIAMQFISKLIRDHASWPLNHMAPSEKLIFLEHDDSENEKLVCECMHKLDAAISTFERKYLLKSVDLTNMILAFASNRGLFFHGYRLLHGNSSQGHDTNRNSNGSLTFGPTIPRLLLKASQEIFCLFSRYVVCCSLTDSILKLLYGNSFTSGSESYGQFHHRVFCLRSVILSLRTISPLLKLCDFSEHLNLIIFSVPDLLEYCVLFASSWFSRNLKGLILMSQTILNEPIDHQSSFDIRSGKLMKVFRQSSEWMIHEVLCDGIGNFLDANFAQGQPQKSETSMVSIPVDETWQLMGACLWIHLSGFANHQLSNFLVKEMIEDGSTVVDLQNELPVLVTKLFVTSTAYISSSLSRQLASFLRHKASKGLPVTSLVWLEESSHYKSSSLLNFSNQRVGPLELTGKEECESLFQKLWEISVHPAEICENFVNERILCIQYNSRKLSGFWKDVQKDIIAEDGNDVSPNSIARGNIGNKTNVMEEGSIFNNRLVTDGLMETRRRNSNPHKDITSFHNPAEVLKRSGELLEAICFNSVDEQQVAVTSNRKGLLFFNWKAEQNFREQAEYLWSESDWPQDGWAGSESTPVSTYVSQGVGRGSKKGRDLTGGAVDPEELPDYHEIIENPMDFGTVRRKLDSGSYENLEQFESDVFLISSNAMRYNAPDTIYYRQARSIQELAKKDFENLRSESDDNEQEPKTVRRGRPPIKNVMKRIGRPPADRTGSDLFSDATLANARDGTHNSNSARDVSKKGSSFDKPSIMDGLRGNSQHRSERNEEYSGSPLKGIPMRNWKKFSALDENRRNTYNQPLLPTGFEEPSVLTTFDGQRKMLMPVGLYMEHAYARSLARFAANLGPIAWEIAAKRIERVLPPGTKFGPGWVGENDAANQFHPPLLSTSPHSPETKVSQSTARSGGDKLPGNHELTSNNSALPPSVLASTTTTTSRPVESVNSTESVRLVKHEGNFGLLGGGMHPKSPLQPGQNSATQHPGNGFNPGYGGFNLPSQAAKMAQHTRSPEVTMTHSHVLDMVSRSGNNSFDNQQTPFKQSDVQEKARSVVCNSNAMNSGSSLPDSNRSSEGQLWGMSLNPKPSSVPPDLNADFQSPGSPIDSKQQKQQQPPDLALQL